MIFLAALIGVAVGMSLGALGGGGSILTVPALVYMLGQNAHAATTASLVIVGVAATAATVAHAHRGRVQFGKGAVFGVLGVAGAVVGSRLSSGISSDILLSAFAGLLLASGAAMIARMKRRLRPPRVLASELVGARAGSESTLDNGIAEPPEDALEKEARDARVVHRHPRIRVVAAATAVGLLTGFFGVGGGFVIVPALVLVLGLDMPEAIGTSLFVIAINSASGLLARIGTHPHVDWRVTIAFVLAAIGGSFAGARLGGRMRPERLGYAFSILLVMVALYVGTRSLPQLV